MRLPLMRIVRIACFVGLLNGMLSLSRAQVPPDQAAELLLNSARKAFNENNYPFAKTKFQEFLQKYNGHPQMNVARFGLALCFLDGPEISYEKAVEPLSQVIGNPAAPEYPHGLYYLGLAQRGLGIADAALAATKMGDEQRQIKARSDSRFQEAAKQFAAATAAFSAKLPKDEVPAELPKELEWAARSRCDQAEMEIRLGKPKEARATAEPFTKDPLLLKSRYRNLGQYYTGYAAFLLQDYLAAGRVLNPLIALNDPVFGLHARYLMGRIYQTTEETDKALAMYDGLLGEFDKKKKEAIESLKNPQSFKNDPVERARLEAIVKTSPDYVPGAVFFSACLLYEAGKFGEALTRFQAFAKDYPNTQYEVDAALRVGFCQVELKQFAEAITTLTPLVDKNPRLSDQVLFWLGKAQNGAALTSDPANPALRETGLKTAIATLKLAGDRAGALLPTDPDAKRRRCEILLAMADAQQQAKLYPDAAAVLDLLRNEKAVPARDEEIVQRLITAVHLLGDFGRSDQLCATFQKDYPRSALLPLVLFRSAENAYFATLAAEKRPDVPKTELPRLFDEAGKRYKLVIDRFPECERVQLARYGLAMCHFKRNEFVEAQQILEAIPGPERIGELSYAPYLLAECLLRQAPAKAEDALQAGMLQEKLQFAQQNLESFLAGNPKAAEVPDAMLKLGICQTRSAVLIAQPQDRNNAIAAARKTFEELIKNFGATPQGVQAVMERAKVLIVAGDKVNAINELRRFAADPLQQTPVAPVAVLQLATLLREQNKGDEAAGIVAATRQRHDAALVKDNVDRAALLRFHHGICLQEAGKFAEARTHLDTIPAMIPGKPLAVEATLRSGQCRIAELRKIIDVQNQQLAGNLSKEQRDALNAQLAASYTGLAEIAQIMLTRAEEFREKQPTLDARGRLLYDAAWAWRQIADREIAAARSVMQVDKQKLLQAEADKKAVPGTKAPLVPVPEIARASVPVQPSEDKARKAYAALIAGFPDSLLSIEAGFELAELLAERAEYEPAIKLLKEAIDKEPSDNKLPSAELLDKLRLRLGACLAANKAYAEAIEKFNTLADNPKSTLLAQGIYRAGECHLELGEFDKAAARFALFRDKPELHNVPGVSDRALLRLGHAYAALKQWEPSKQALVLLTQRYPTSRWVNEARYGIGWASQNLGQFDPAVDAYNGVIANTANELAAKAHLQIGLCRLEQKRFGDAATALLVVPYTFDYPDLSAAALTEAARALAEDKKPEQAERVLQRVIKDYPASEWAKIAQQRLSELKK